MVGPSRSALPMLAARALGWGLVALALIAAAIEAGVLMARDDWGTMSAKALWDYAAPYSLRQFRSSVRVTLGAAGWDYGVGLLLTLPAWLLFGAPGVGLVYATHSHNPPTAEELLIQSALERPEPEAEDSKLDPKSIQALMDSIPDDPEKGEKSS